jgi:o-succinylbenzoate synthase
VLHFKRPAATSRGALEERRTCIVQANDSGLGECCIMPGLLPEPTAQELEHWCRRVEEKQGLADISAPSPIQFALECSLLAALSPGQPRWDTAFARGDEGIPIHHLIWMDSTDKMLTAMHEGINKGFTCLKMKVGALPFAEEMAMLNEAHRAFPQAEIRVDANGAFSPDDALHKLEQLAQAGVSSLEQPIRPGQWSAMAEICRHSPVPIALDEELIGNKNPEQLLEALRPHALVIKPSLHGGLLAAEHWAKLAEVRNVNWWVNSALESHVGLTVLAEWCAYATPGRLQGLGTGQLFADDTPGAVYLQGNCLKMRGN